MAESEDELCTRVDGYSWAGIGELFKFFFKWVVRRVSVITTVIIYIAGFYHKLNEWLNLTAFDKSRLTYGPIKNSVCFATNYRYCDN